MEKKTTEETFTYDLAIPIVKTHNRRYFMGNSNMINNNLKVHYTHIQCTPMNTCQYNCELKILTKYQKITVSCALEILI